MRTTSILLLALAAFSGNAFAECTKCKPDTAKSESTCAGKECPLKADLKAAHKELAEAKKSGDKAAIEAAEKKVAEAKKACEEATKAAKKDKAAK